MIFSLLIRALALIGISLICFIYGREISFADQWPLYEALRNTSAIIFGVMGAWLAIVYPGSLSDILKEQKTPDSTVTKLISPIVISTFILILVLVIGVVVPIVKQISLILKFQKIARGLSYSVLGISTVLQIWTLLMTLLPADMVNREFSRRKEKQRIRNSILSRTQKRHKE